MSETMNTTATGTCTREKVETSPKPMSATEICFGALMGIGAIAGIWGAVSLLINICVR